jgi:hypothetical protein
VRPATALFCVWALLPAPYFQLFGSCVVWMILVSIVDYQVTVFCSRSPRGVTIVGR